MISFFPFLQRPLPSCTIRVRNAAEKSRVCWTEAPCTLTQKEGGFPHQKPIFGSGAMYCSATCRKPELKLFLMWLTPTLYCSKLSSSIFGFVDTVPLGSSFFQPPQLKVGTRSSHQECWEPELCIESVMDHAEHWRESAGLLPPIPGVRSGQMHNITQRSNTFQ